MRWILLLFSSLLTFLLLSSPLMGNEKPTVPHLIIDARFGNLFGGTIDDFWVSAEDLEHEIAGNETYRIYSSTRFLGTATGGKPYLKDKERQFSPLLIDLKLPNAVKSVKRNAPLIAVACDWNALPRKPELPNVKARIYQRAARKILDMHGLPKAPVSITKVIRVDMEGDGPKEVILSATTPRKAFPEEFAKKNDYSFVVILKKLGDKEFVIPVTENYYPEDNDPAGQPSNPVAHSLEAVLDLDGDGEMEIVTSWKDPFGYSKTVHIIRDIQAYEVLWSGYEG